ncbi:uncharacterized protein LOC134190364 [Corticium candelabrum]|uniref:uncharacterized protein LOC134190364 n=1 Tax=Corticium candelabrum TaxID=121492 RepID=UPI002E25C6AB|nr:uncharacterized protein LOC134190364 [Corticium candelabrum]
MSFHPEMLWTPSRRCINRRWDCGRCDHCSRGHEPMLADMICQEWPAPASCACGSASAVSNIGFCTSTEIHKRTSFCIFVRCGTEQLCVPVFPCTTGFHIKRGVEMRTGLSTDVLKLHSRRSVVAL